MKKLTCVFLILVLICLALLPACERQEPVEEEVPEEENQVEIEYESLVNESGEVTYLDSNTLAYINISSMMESIGNIIEYRQISGETLDMSDLSADDFWTLLSLSLNGYHEDGIADEYGIFHVDEDVVSEYAAAFLMEYPKYAEIPAPKDCYAASKDPGSKLYDILPIDVSNYIVTLDSVEITTLNNVFFLNVTLRGSDSEALVNHLWTVTVKTWDDGQYHNIPFRVRRAVYKRTDYFEIPDLDVK